MKKTLHILGFAVLLAGLTMAISSCSSKTKSQDSPDSQLLSPKVDTTGLAEFQAWKAMNERKSATDYYMQGYRDAVAKSTPAKPVTKTRTVYKSVAASPAPVPQTVKKKGWSKAAKGTAIGAATGAIAGALLNKKNRLVGGIIGGIVGGGGGYVIGRGMDKKDGRY